MSTEITVADQVRTALTEFSTGREIADHMLPVAKARIAFARDVAKSSKFSRKSGRSRKEVAKLIRAEFPTKKELTTEFWFCDEALRAPINERVIQEACFHLAAVMANGSKAINAMKVQVLISELMAGDIEGTEAAGYSLHFGPAHVLYAIREIVRRDDFFPSVATVLAECRKARNLLLGHRHAAGELLTRIQWANDELDPAGPLAGPSND
ncbi:hypothetical protein [Aminobacter sp. AP02]|uniref:hypothetical protein n=1 Tax=Aminobacter sp. AP02 TaxID=2135737 RepID=UPI000D7A7ED0|nr:hypothetical protein [Aminobacter sp. AP02]PWK66937.1 hypothetical protein C8K44_11353 [Aminobacter sp. AP02]